MKFSFFNRLKRKRKKENIDTDIEFTGFESGRQHIAVELCEQMIDSSREIETIRDEYRVVTSYLNDIQIIEDLLPKEREGIIDSATHIMNLNKIRDELLETRNRISEAEYAQFQEEDANITQAIKRLSNNETYLAAIERDLHTLEGEKLSWNIDKKEAQREMRQLRKLSIWLLALFGMLILVFLILTIGFNKSVMLPMFIAMFVVVCLGAYALIHYQDAQRDVKQCELNINHAITLENHVKIRYVNMKNAVDYACGKYHVNNSRELVYRYEQYQEMVKEKRKFKEANDDLQYYSEKLIRKLREHQLYDPSIWVNYAHALADKNEMVELKHDLLIRRQKLRSRLEYNLNNLNDMKEKALLNIDKEGDNRAQIEAIIQRLDKMNQNII